MCVSQCKCVRVRARLARQLDDDLNQEAVLGAYRGTRLTRQPSVMCVTHQLTEEAAAGRIRYPTFFTLEGGGGGPKRGEWFSGLLYEAGAPLNLFQRIDLPTAGALNG